jgi:hypothetical protein
MSTFIGMRFRRSVLTLSSAALSSGGKLLHFFCMIGLYYVVCVSQASWQIASSLKINPRSYLFQFPILYLPILLTGKVLRRSNFGVGGSKPARNLIVFKYFCSIKTVAIVSYFVLLPKNSVAPIDNDLEML